MSDTLPKQYDPHAVEQDIYRRWQDSGAFRAAPRLGQRSYVIMMPLPNVTGALHMGHAIDNLMQDLLTRWHRMQGDNALWMPGIDHAGIATQAVVEKRLLELEGKTRHDLGREALVERIWAWNDQFKKRIVEQQQAMGCSCDWSRHRYTMDPVCARAVRWTFFKMFRDGLIYQGDRMVNWDCQLQTAVSDDEIVRETRTGSFWHLRYSVIDPRPGEPEFVEVATTRPETMLGDTAVACHPDPAAALQRAVDAARRKLDNAPAREREACAAEVEALEARRLTHLDGLVRLAEMARDGRAIRLPLQERAIPLIVDEWAKPELGSGCVKITPAHDPNDHEVWQRHRERIDSINILNTDGTLNAAAGRYAGLSREEARKRVVQDLESEGRVAKVEERSVELALSDRSKTIIEPFVSRQWFVRMEDIEGGVVCGRGTGNEFRADGLAEAALDAARSSWRSPTGRRLAFHPDPERYRNTYINWLAEKRDWCISRQLWWGHRIPVWSAPAQACDAALLDELLARDDVSVRIGQEDGDETRALEPGSDASSLPPTTSVIQVGVRDEDEAAELVSRMEAAGFVRDPDVLDTWFSSGLWPHSTLGWPDPESAPLDEGQAALGAVDGRPDCLDYYYPGSCLVTGRDIITLWVVRMVVMGLYNLGDVPFTDVFVHATILDGKGERMSKSKGNGIDPVDIIERYGTDAMRYVLSEMQTGTQDIRLPVQAISPFTGETVDLARARHGQSIFSYICPGSGKEFDVLGTLPDMPQAKLVSDRFEVGRNFCNKLWNATRFALMNLEGARYTPLAPEDLAEEDRWILSRLSRVIGTVNASLESYNPAAAIGAAREFFWGELCDWYLEIIKPRMASESDAPAARQVLAVALDQVLRLLHPFIPFITELLWEKLAERAPERGIDGRLPVEKLLLQAPWPVPRAAWEDDELEARFDLLQEVVRALRDLRSRHSVRPAQRLVARARATGDFAGFLQRSAHLVVQLSGLERLDVSETEAAAGDSATAVVRDAEIYLDGVVDREEESKRLSQQREKLAADLERARRKLGNENFVKKARPEAVEKERLRAADIESRLRSIESRLEALS